MSNVIALLTVICTAAVGFRRAGFELTPGENTLENVSSEQLEMLESDPCITVVDTEASSGAINSDASKTPSITDLVEIIESLNKDNPGLWTSDNKPKASNFPRSVTAEQREEAWEMYLASLEQ